MFRTHSPQPQSDRNIARIPVAAIRPNPAQPRRSFSQAAVDELAASIRRHGLLSPLLVRKREDGGFELIAGERRLRALVALQRSHAEAIVVSAGDCECALIALVENIQREQLHFLDEAEACRRILEQYPITQEKLAISLSRSPSALANRLRLLKLSPDARAVIRETGLTERHARALLGLEDPRMQTEFARLAASGRMSVKQLEARIEHQSGQRRSKPDQRACPLIRDNRIVINALMDTVRELGRIGVRVSSRVEAKEDHVEVVVCIPACAAVTVNKQEESSQT